MQLRNAGNVCSVRQGLGVLLCYLDCDKARSILQACYKTTIATAAANNASVMGDIARAAVGDAGDAIEAPVETVAKKQRVETTEDTLAMRLTEKSADYIAVYSDALVKVMDANTRLEVAKKETLNEEREKIYALTTQMEVKSKCEQDILAAQSKNLEVKNKCEMEKLKLEHDLALRTINSKRAQELAEGLAADQQHYGDNATLREVYRDFFTEAPFPAGEITFAIFKDSFQKWRQYYRPNCWRCRPPFNGVIKEIYGHLRTVVLHGQKQHAFNSQDMKNWIM